MRLVSTDLDSRGIAVVTLNDAQRRNAMSQAMAVDFRSAVAELQMQPRLRVVILTGAGAAFSAGGDLKMLQQKSEQSQPVNYQEMLDFYQSFLSVLSLPVPLIAAINGHAVGAGFCLALACDFRIGASDAKLALNFARLGLHAGMGATLFLPRITRTAVATDLLLTGRTITASEASSTGLLHTVVDTAHVVASAFELAARLLEVGPEAIKAMLQTLRPRPDDVQATLQREAEMQSIEFATAEFREGLAAAIGRRSPQF